MNRGALVLLVMPLLLLLALFGGGSAGTASTIRPVMMIVTERADVPLELRPFFEAHEELYGINWPYFAAYIWHRLDGEWDVPVTSRLARLRENREYNHDLRLHPCHSESFFPTHDPDACDDYDEPSDKPTDFATLDAQWRRDARRWLDERLFDLFDVSSDSELIAIPAPRDVKGRIQEHVSQEEWRIVREQARIYDEFYAALEEEPNIRELADREDATVCLKCKDWEYRFPVEGGARFGNDWGADRPQNRGYASPRHHGTDLFAGEGTPLLAVADGEVFKAGWNYLGGWTVTIRAFDGMLYYYAHMQGPSLLHEGQRVERDTVVGYLGDSGEGPEGTSGRLPPHLHFGMYTNELEDVTNPFSYLAFWEDNPPARLRCPSGAC